MMTFEEGLYVRIQQLENGPRPFPLDSGFSLDTVYRVLGLYNPSETSDAFFILANDRDEIWFICNRHVRAAYISRDPKDLRRSFSALPSKPTHYINDLKAYAKESLASG